MVPSKMVSSSANCACNTKKVVKNVSKSLKRVGIKMWFDEKTMI
jgi:hypothetical protein